MSIDKDSANQPVKLYIGQTVWLVRSNHYRKEHEPIESTISSIGGKYFKLKDGDTRRKFDIETLKLVTESNYVDRCYLTLGEILDEKESDKLVRQIRSIFRDYGKSNLTLEQLRNIMTVVSEI